VGDDGAFPLGMACQLAHMVWAYPGWDYRHGHGGDRGGVTGAAEPSAVAVAETVAAAAASPRSAAAAPPRLAVPAGRVTVTADCDF
jgi:hypothetical protein